MKYAYVGIVTMILGGLILADASAQGRARGRTSSQESVRTGDDDDRRERTARGRTGRSEDDVRIIFGDTRDDRNASRRDRDDGDDVWEDDDERDDDDDDRYDQRRRDRSIGDIIFGRDDDRYERRNDRRRGNGPPFCRDGRGHPVHGWEWCEDKGYGDGRYDPIWRDSRRNDDIIYRLPRRDRDRRRTVRGGILDDILGRRAYRELDRYRRDLNLRGGLSGYWLDNDFRALLVRSGDVPLAEFRDYDGDRRVDAVRFNSRRY